MENHFPEPRYSGNIRGRRWKKPEMEMKYSRTQSAKMDILIIDINALAEAASGSCLKQ